VIADSEPIHFLGFQKILQGEGIALSKRDYYGRYLGYSDRECFLHVYRDRKHRLPQNQLKKLIQKKTRYVKSLLRSHSILLPGARRAIKMLGRRYSMVIVSGALRGEIQLVLRQEKLRPYFKSIVAAEDVKQGKPHPDGYLQARRLLGVKARECLVIEDSHWGIEAAHRAGMPCLALATSYAKKDLQAADLILSGLQDVKVALLSQFNAL